MIHDFLYKCFVTLYYIRHEIFVTIIFVENHKCLINSKNLIKINHIHLRWGFRIKYEKNNLYYHQNCGH
jgi:hypothetical protein